MTLGPVSLLPRHVSVPRIGSQETKSSRARARAEDGSYKMISLPVPVLPTYQTRPPSPACQDDPCPRLFCGAASIQNIEKPSTATTTCGCRLASLTRPARTVAEQAVHPASYVSTAYGQVSPSTPWGLPRPRTRRCLARAGSCPRKISTHTDLVPPGVESKLALRPFSPSAVSSLLRF